MRSSSASWCRRLKRRVEALPERLYAIDAVKLLESGLDHLCDQTIAVTAPLELRVRRIMARDGITEQYARLRISAQKADEYYRSKCDCELTNSADTAEAFQADAGCSSTGWWRPSGRKNATERSEHFRL